MEGEKEREASQDEAEGGDEFVSWGNMSVNLYYALVNLAIMLGSIGLLMVAYWLFKWATASCPHASPPVYSAQTSCGQASGPSLLLGGMMHARACVFSCVCWVVLTSFDAVSRLLL